ncbi:HTH domain-containing protein [Oerskovia sp. M15]
MLDTSVRLLRLLSLLQVRREWSGADLATRLDVTTRTVRNDVERLRLLGYEVRSRTGTAGGYRLEAGSELPPLLLDDDEAVAVAVGLQAAAAGRSRASRRRRCGPWPSSSSHSRRGCATVWTRCAGRPCRPRRAARRSTPRSSPRSRPRSAAASACASTTSGATACRPCATSSRTASSTRAAAGTCSRGTPRARTGGRSAPTA